MKEALENPTPTLRDISSDQLEEESAISSVEESTPERMATVWVSRITGLVGGVFLLLALSVWLGRPGHYRLVLAFLVIAMFAAIIHSYTFESGNPE